MNKQVILQVGGSYEFYFRGDEFPQWDKGTVKYLSKNHLIVLFEDEEENYYDLDKFYRKCQFRPIQTERVKFIECVCTALHYTHSDEHADLASALYDAGFRAPQKGEI